MPVQRRVAAGVLSAGHARALLSLDEPSVQEELAARIVAEGLSVRGTEEAVTLLAGRGPCSRRTPVKRTVTPGIEELAGDLGDLLDTRVLVDMGRKKGRIVIEFATTDDLSRISDVIRGRRASDRGPASISRPEMNDNGVTRHPRHLRHGDAIARHGRDPCSAAVSLLSSYQRHRLSGAGSEVRIPVL